MVAPTELLGAQWSHLGSPRGFMMPHGHTWCPQVAERRPALRSPSSPRKRPKGRVRLDPLVGAGPLAAQGTRGGDMGTPKKSRGITALHNAICGANYNVVDFLIASGANVNSPDSHGW
uniref:Uncharacterized protein n=1 Tax=Nothoprocta perdicaria TaxID=30464 RepID=A0A8C6ZKB6_NOTPE